MARINCKKCGVEIPDDDVNVGEGVAYCRACGNLSSLAEILEDELATGGISVEVDEPPTGCSIHNDGMQIRVVASAQSARVALFTLVFGAFWNGMVSVFILTVIADTIRLIGWTVPPWFPTPVQGFGSSPGVILFMWIFQLPFIAVGLGMIAVFLTAAMGRYEVAFIGESGYLRSGVGPLVWRRKFDASAVISVQQGVSRWAQNGQHQPCVEIATDKGKHRIGSTLRDDRRAWMVAALRSLLVTR